MVSSRLAVPVLSSLVSVLPPMSLLGPLLVVLPSRLVSENCRKQVIVIFADFPIAGMAYVSAPSTAHASVTFDGYDVSTGTAATSLQSGKCKLLKPVIVRFSDVSIAGFAYVSAPLATGASAKSDSNYMSSGTGSTNLAATNTAKPLVMRAALDPILSSMASLFTTLPTTTTPPSTSTTTTTTLPAAAATTGASIYADETPQLSAHDFRTVQIAIGVGVPVFVFLALTFCFWLDRKDLPKPMHRAWPDDAYTGRGGFELRQWRRIPGETPNVERKGWRKFFAWWKK